MNNRQRDLFCYTLYIIIMTYGKFIYDLFWSNCRTSATAPKNMLIPEFSSSSVGLNWSLRTSYSYLVNKFPKFSSTIMSLTLLSSVHCYHEFLQPHNCHQLHYILHTLHSRLLSFQLATIVMVFDCALFEWNIVDYQEHHHAWEKFGFAVSMMQVKRNNFLTI